MALGGGVQTPPLLPFIGAAVERMETINMQDKTQERDTVSPMDAEQMNSTLKNSHEQMVDIVEMLNDTCRMANECVAILKDIEAEMI